jgi:hypothetical protein
VAIRGAFRLCGQAFAACPWCTDSPAKVASPSTVRKDRLQKFRLYAATGVKEYWMLTPYPPMAEVYLLDGPGYRAHGAYTERETLVSPTFPDLELELDQIFPYVDLEELRESPSPYTASLAPR